MSTISIDNIDVTPVSFSLGSDGAIEISATTNTGNPIEYQLDSGSFQTGSTFSNLTTGTYTVTVRTDANNISASGDIIDYGSGDYDFVASISTTDVVSQDIVASVRLVIGAFDEFDTYYTESENFELTLVPGQQTAEVIRSITAPSTGTTYNGINSVTLLSAKISATQTVEVTEPTEDPEEPTSGGTSGGTQTGDTIIIESLPELIVASENPILVSLSSKVLTQTPTFSKNEISVNGTVAEGDNIKFIVNQQPAITLTAKDNPGFSEFFSSTDSTSFEIANSLRFAINDHPLLSQMYFATASGSSVSMTAKVPSSSFDLTGLFIQITSSGISNSLVQSGSSEFYAETKRNYGYYVNCYVENEAGEFEFIKTIEQPYVKPRNHFDLSGILRNYVNSSLPVYSPTQYQKSDQHLKRYNFDLGELYSKSSTGYKFQYPFAISGQSYYVLNAALPLPVNNTVSSYNKSGFLSNAPDIKQVHSGQKDYLYFLSTTAVSDIILKYKFSYWDGTESYWRNLYTASIPSAGVYYLESSPAIFPISAETKGVWKISVKLYADSGNTFNQSFTYELSPEESQTGFDILFKNSLGAFESHRFSGEVTDSIEREVETYQKSYYGKLNSSDSLVTTKKVIVQNTYSLNSGLVSSEMFSWLKELAKSTDLYIRKNETWVSINATRIRYEKSTDDDFYSISLDAVESIPENSIAI